MMARLEAFPKPVIAAVNGLAFGGGCEITEAVHLAIASENAFFAKPEISIGIPPTFGGTQRMPRLAGRKRALEYLLTGERFYPQRAYEIGLINQAVPKDRLLAASSELAHRIRRHCPLTTARIISAVTRGLNTSIAEGLAIEGEQFARMAATQDTRKALDAWLSHHAPVAGRRQNANLSCYGEITTSRASMGSTDSSRSSGSRGQRSLQSRCRFGATKLWWIIGATLQSTARCRPPVVATSFATIVGRRKGYSRLHKARQGTPVKGLRGGTLPADVMRLLLRRAGGTGATAAPPPAPRREANATAVLHTCTPSRALFVAVLTLQT